MGGLGRGRGVRGRFAGAGPESDLSFCGILVAFHAKESVFHVMTSGRSIPETIETLADCVNSSPPLILRKFQGFGGIWANSGKFGTFRENSGELSGIQWGFVWHLV